MGASDKWPRVLQEFKAKEDRRVVVVAQRMHEAPPLLGAWPSAEQLVVMPTSLETRMIRDGTDVQRWWWLWQTRFPDGPPWIQWADLAGLNGIRNRTAMERLIALRLVYPDGGIHVTVSAWVNDLVAQEMKATMEAAKRRPKSPSKERPE